MAKKNILTPELIDLLPTNDQIKKGIGNAKQAEKISGRKRPDQSARMSGDGNSMAGKEHPNKGKSMPQISKMIKGKAKPEGHGAKVSAAKKGVPIPKLQGRKKPEHSRRLKENNPMFRPIRTPHGDFISIRFVIADEKIRGMKNVERRVRKLLNTPNSGYYYIKESK